MVGKVRILTESWNEQMSAIEGGLQQLEKKYKIAYDDPDMQKINEGLSQLQAWFEEIMRLFE